jgi:hypothetical protein
MHVRALRAKIFFVAKAVGASLEDTDFVVEAFDEAERDLIFGFALGPVDIHRNAMIAAAR